MIIIDCQFSIVDVMFQGNELTKDIIVNLVKIPVKAVLLFFAIYISAGLYSQIQLGETTVDTSTIITGLDIPWELQWGPDDWLWVTERFGRVSRVNPETGEQDIILDISGQVSQSGESGLLGMVLHPDFESSPYVYMAYTYLSGGNITEKIVRYEYSVGQLVDEMVLLDNIPGNSTHDGCRLIITPDMKLLATTGDAQNQPAAQNINSLLGKVLRINLDGSIPDDNPWPGNPVWSYGHRNPQGLFLADNGILYSSEHGPSTDDELNIIEEARNYGWPNVHGFCNLPDEITFCNANNVKEPVLAWTPTVAASDIVHYDHPSISEWQNSILMTTLKNKRIYALKLDESGTEVTEENQYFTNLWGRLRDICVGPNGEIYLATNGPDWGNSEPFTHSIVKVWNPEFTSVGQLAVGQLDISVYPNPTNGISHFSIRISQSQYVTLKIYDLHGVEVATVVDDWRPAGEHEVRFDAGSLPPGVYIYRKSAVSSQQLAVGKLIIIE
jgi:glucose/arabinose dehydrogenase